MTRAFAAILAISMAVVWAGGCQEEQASSGDKMARLLAAENKNLQTQLKERDDKIINLKTEAQKRDDEIKNLKTQLQTEISKRDDDIQIARRQLGECAQTRGDQLQEEADKQCKESISAMNDWNSELKDEVDRLKAELAKAKGEEKK